MKGLHIDSIRKNYGNRQVLSDIYLNCQQGDIIGLMGRNGTGKSTLLKIIFGTENAETKFVRVDDKVIRKLSDCANRIAYLPQHHFLPNKILVQTAIQLFCDKKSAEQVSKNEYIEPLLRKHYSTLSGGKQRLLEVILVIHSRAPYVLLDEPFNGIAPIVKEEIKRQIQSTQKGFIIADHDYRNVMSISSQLILLYDGACKKISHHKELLQWGYLPE